MIFTLYYLRHLEVVFLTLSLGFGYGHSTGLRNPKREAEGGCVALPLPHDGHGDVPASEANAELCEVNDDDASHYSERIRWNY